MSIREKRLQENLDQALVHLAQACSALNASGLNHLWFTTKAVHAGVLQVRETMVAYPITRRDYTPTKEEENLPDEPWTYEDER